MPVATRIFDAIHIGFALRLLLIFLAAKSLPTARLRGSVKKQNSTPATHGASAKSLTALKQKASLRKKSRKRRFQFSAADTPASPTGSTGISCCGCTRCARLRLSFGRWGGYLRKSDTEKKFTSLYTHLLMPSFTAQENCS